MAQGTKSVAKTRMGWGKRKRFEQFLPGFLFRHEITKPDSFSDVPISCNFKSLNNLRNFGKKGASCRSPHVSSGTENAAEGFLGDCRIMFDGSRRRPAKLYTLWVAYRSMPRSRFAVRFPPILGTDSAVFYSPFRMIKKTSERISNQAPTLPQSRNTRRRSSGVLLFMRCFWISYLIRARSVSEG